MNWRRHSFVLLGCMLHGAVATAAEAGLDCGRAGTGAEKAICGDPELKALDQQTGRLFVLVRDGSRPAVRKALLAIQKTWLAHRDAACPTALRECLLPVYRQHRTWLDALSNRLSADAPLGDLKAYALTGRWSVQAVVDPVDPGKPLSRDTISSMAFNSLPSPGDVVEGRGAQTCYQDGCRGFGWEPHPLRFFDGLYKKGWTAQLGPATQAFVLLLNGRTKFTVVQSSPTTLDADVTICEARAVNCHGGYQTWRAISPNAALSALQP